MQSKIIAAFAMAGLALLVGFSQQVEGIQKPLNVAVHLLCKLTDDPNECRKLKWFPIINNHKHESVDSTLSTTTTRKYNSVDSAASTTTTRKPSTDSPVIIINLPPNTTFSSGSTFLSSTTVSSSTKAPSSTTVPSSTTAPLSTTTKVPNITG